MARYGNVEITDESYVPGGFSVEDYLIPGKPNIDWDSVGVSYAGGLSQPETEKEGRSFAGEEPDLSNVKMARKRRSGLENTMLGIADILRISASMPNVYGQSAIKPGSAYLGMSEEEANKRAKIRMEEDPEGKAADINRAKVLSARAGATDDIDLKKKYGAAIKELLPDETQGLDDLTASDYFNSADNKLKLEQLKGYNKLREIAARNAGNLDVAAANNASRELIAAEKVNAQKQMNELDNQIKQAIADGKNDVAIQLLNMKNEQSDYIHQLDNEAAFAREALKQAGATTRERMSQTGQNYRTEYAQNAATERNKYTADSAFDRTMYAQNEATKRTQITQNAANERALTKASQQVKADATPITNPNTGNLIPNEGVIAAVNMIAENPNAFTATASAVDNMVGRTTGMLSDEEIQVRERVTQELAPLVRTSTANLMALFPKGGSGVINSPKEQELFLPVAAAIQSGEKNKIIPAIKAFYGNMYDECKKAAGENPPISRSEYIRFMMTGKTSDGKTELDLTPKDQKTMVGNFVGKNKPGKIIQLSF